MKKREGEVARKQVNVHHMYRSSKVGSDISGQW